jgi:periplasmic divalent cation tolerance protein
MEVAFVYIVAGSEEEAKRIGRTLLEKKLVACVNIWKISSNYWWKGEIQGDEEFALLAKTMAEKVEAVKEEVLELHSYELPCIVWWNVKGYDPYISWIEETVSGRPRRTTASIP